MRSLAPADAGRVVSGGLMGRGPCKQEHWYIPAFLMGARV